MNGPATNAPEAPSPEPRAPRERRVTIALALEQSGPILALAVLIVLVLAFVPAARTWENWRNISRQTAVVAILAAGETVVIVSGGIDLSVGSLIAFTGVLSGLAMRISGVPPALAFPLGILVALMSGAVAGLVSGLVTELARIPSFVVTLGMMGIASGTAKLACNGMSVSGLPPEVSGLGQAHVLVVVPVAGLLAIGVTIVGQIVLGRTRFGRTVYALGGNREAARLSGIPVKKVGVACFVLCGMLAGLAGIVSMARMGSAQSTAGEGLELQAVAAAVIGGTSLMGGEGSIAGSFIGALIMGIIATTLDLVGVSQFAQPVVIGSLIIVAVIADRVRRRGHA